MFNEKDKEIVFENGQKLEVPVWQSPKYTESKKKALEMIKKYEGQITEGDFWILMNKTKTGKMAYTGLIISHNGCLKLNDMVPTENKFKPECVKYDNNGFANSLVFTYSCPEQGIYEVGEVNAKNCKNEYPYAMAFKRCFDRVVLKISKLAYSGIYSDSEADEFSQQIVIDEVEVGSNLKPTNKITEEQLKELYELGFDEQRLESMALYYKAPSIDDISFEQAEETIKKQKKALAKAKKEGDNGQA